ncbi:MAG: hypothetical protein AAF961_09350, partial [Planctomycetota bacterium]
KPSPLAARYRSYHGTVQHQVVVFGGAGYPVQRNQTEFQDGAIYNLATNEWRALPPAPAAFASGAVSAVWKNKFLVLGGRDQSSGAIYDADRGRWETIPAAPDYVSQSAVAVADDQLFVWSGDSGRKSATGAVYSFVEEEWKVVPDSPIVPRYSRRARSIGRKVVVFGGWDPNRGGFLRDGAIFDLDSRVWSKIEPAPLGVVSALRSGW